MCGKATPPSPHHEPIGPCRQSHRPAVAPKTARTPCDNVEGVFGRANPRLTRSAQVLSCRRHILNIYSVYVFPCNVDLRAHLARSPPCARCPAHPDGHRSARCAHRRMASAWDRSHSRRHRQWKNGLSHLRCRRIPSKPDRGRRGSHGLAVPPGLPNVDLQHDVVRCGSIQAGGTTQLAARRPADDHPPGSAATVSGRRATSEGDGERPEHCSRAHRVTRSSPERPGSSAMHGWWRGPHRAWRKRQRGSLTPSWALSR